jgi:hypothetical protein
MLALFLLLSVDGFQNLQRFVGVVEVFSWGFHAHITARLEAGVKGRFGYSSRVMDRRQREMSELVCDFWAMPDPS